MYFSILNANLEVVGHIISPNHLIIVLLLIMFVSLFNLLSFPLLFFFFLLFCINVPLASRQIFLNTPSRYLI